MRGKLKIVQLHWGKKKNKTKQGSCLKKVPGTNYNGLELRHAIQI